MGSVRTLQVLQWCVFKRWSPSMPWVLIKPFAWETGKCKRRDRASYLHYLFRYQSVYIKTIFTKLIALVPGTRYHLFTNRGRGADQLAEHWTEKSDAILTEVSLPHVAKDISPSVNFKCIYIYICLWYLYSPHVQSHALTYGSNRLFGHTKILHTLVGMESDVLVALARWLVIWISCKG